jgi:RNA polymerase-associated protein CTR9
MSHSNETDLSTTSESDRSKIEKSMKMIEKAHQVDNTHSMALNHLSNHFFFRELDFDAKDKNYARMIKLAEKAHNFTEVPEVKAESLFLIGRVWHERGDLAKAIQFYREAHNAWPGHSLTQYAIAQLQMGEKETEKAIRSFEKVLKAYPDSAETLIVLAALYAEGGVRILL